MYLPCPEGRNKFFADSNFGIMCLTVQQWLNIGGAKFDNGAKISYCHPRGRSARGGCQGHNSKRPKVLSVWGNDSVERAANASRTERADMGVDHRCADVLVAKKFLDGTNVVAVIE